MYQQAVYYDIALSRDVSRETGFIQAAYRHYTGSELRSVLDIACGPGYHARDLARRGLRAIGLDLRPEMVAFARDQVASEDLDLTWQVGDMRDFRLEAPVDMAICMFDAIDALLTNDDLVQHLRSVAGNLVPRGLYLIDLTHPRDSSYQNYGAFSYSGQRDDVSVEIVWATNNPHYDPVAGVAYVELEMRVRTRGQTTVIHDSAQERLLTAQEICLLAELSGALQVVGWHGDFDLNRPLDNSPASPRMVAILQKKGPG